MSFEEGSDAMSGENGQGGRRNERVNATESKDERQRGDPTAGKMRVVGVGPVQNKPDKNAQPGAVVDVAAEMNQAREQATEALRQQKVGPAQRDLVSDFYKNLTPEKK